MFVLDNDKRNMKKRKFYDEHLGVRPRVEIKLNIYESTAQLGLKEKLILCILT